MPSLASWMKFAPLVPNLWVSTAQRGPSTLRIWKGSMTNPTCKDPPQLQMMYKVWELPARQLRKTYGVTILHLPMPGREILRSMMMKRSSLLMWKQRQATSQRNTRTPRPGPSKISRRWTNSTSGSSPKRARLSSTCSKWCLPRWPISSGLAKTLNPMTTSKSSGRPI